MRKPDKNRATKVSRDIVSAGIWPSLIMQGALEHEV